MANYRLTEASWLSYEVSRVRSILIFAMERGRVYTPSEVLVLLGEYGLHYANPEYIPIGQALLAEGVIEEVIT